MTRVGLVLGAGGYVGQAFHLGVLTALAEAGWDPRRADVLVGTSAGSLVATGLAAGYAPADQRAQLLGEPLSAEARALRARSSSPRPPVPVLEAPPVPPGRGPLAPTALLAALRRPLSVRVGAVGAGLLPAGRVSTDGIVRSIDGLLPGGWPEPDLRVCAVRVRDGARRVLRRGATDATPGTAVAASCAIPGWFRPVGLDGDLHVDGGVHSPSNADVLLPDRPDVVLVLSPMSARAVGRGADAGLRLAVRGYLAGEVRRLRRGGAEVVVVQPGPEDVAVMGSNPMRSAAVSGVLRQAHSSTTARLGRGGRLAELLERLT